MTYFVGIDIAKYKHDCFIHDHNGVVIHHSFTFSNNQTGFKELLSVLDSLDKSQKIKIGFEATGHYGSNLKQFLKATDFDFMEINPLLIKQFSQATTLRKTKTDKIDSALISRYLSTVDYKPTSNQSYHIQALKSLSRLRDSLVKNRSQILVRMTVVLDIIFPEYKPFFDNKLNSSTCIYILENYGSPERISRMNMESYNKMKRKLRHTISYGRFTSLKDLAKNTVGTTDDIYLFQLNTLLEIYKNIDNKIKNIESKIIQEYRQTNSHIHTIKGISEVSAAGIYAEFGGVHNFMNPNQMLAFAGLESSRYQSGQENFKGHMVKHGSGHLRQIIMNVVDTFALNNPVIYDYQLKKIKEGKHWRVAQTHVARKLVRIIFHLEKNNMDFNSNLLK